jgi:hypothetical protein
LRTTGDSEDSITVSDDTSGFVNALKFTGATTEKGSIPVFQGDLDAAAEQIGKLVGAINEALVRSGKGPKEVATLRADAFAALETAFKNVGETRLKGLRLEEFAGERKIAVEKDRVARALGEDPESFAAALEGPEGVAAALTRALERFQNAPTQVAPPKAERPTIAVDLRPPKSRGLALGDLARALRAFNAASARSTPTSTGSSLNVVA